MNKENVNSEIIKCTDYYGEIIRIGDYVISIDDNSNCNIVLEVIQKDKEFCIKILRDSKTILHTENPKDYCILKNNEDRNKRIHKWIAKDMKEKNHIYTQYKDIDGIPLAERMVLEDAWGNERKLYYVTKDSEASNYYLQSFFESRDKRGKNRSNQVMSVKRDMEYAVKNLQVESRFESGKVSFLDDYGFKGNTFPPKRNVINGKVFFE